MTVGELKQKLKGVPDNLQVYISDHDHGTYETNGKLGFVSVLDQKDKSETEILDKIYYIKGKYVCLTVM